MAAHITNAVYDNEKAIVIEYFLNHHCFRNVDKASVVTQTTCMS